MVLMKSLFIIRRNYACIKERKAFKSGWIHAKRIVFNVQNSRGKIVCPLYYMKHIGRNFANNLNSTLELYPFLHFGDNNDVIKLFFKCPTQYTT